MIRAKTFDFIAVSPIFYIHCVCCTSRRYRIIVYLSLYKARKSTKRNYFTTFNEVTEYLKSTVEPVFGTLTQFMGLRKINTIGFIQANKVMHMATIAYNLKKYLNFITKKVQSDHRVSFLILFNTNVFKNKQRSVLSSFYFSF
ncbi:transposase [Tenacibaculum maritimum]|uniref:transposase n=1 Tax=Tenacibaculum maritimum TaxID=107401 RepID=UPI001F2993E4|nr:transposase [Tenacibaculum maritimum]